MAQQTLVHAEAAVEAMRGRPDSPSEERDVITIGGNSYILGRTLGQGSFGTVQLCERQRARSASSLRVQPEGEGELFACKVYNTSMLKRQRSYQKQGRRMVVTDGVDKVHDEVAVMKKMTHPCTLGLYEFLDDTEADRLYVVMQYMPLGAVMDWDSSQHRFSVRTGARVLRDEGMALPESRARAYFVDVLCALRYLHENKICHRDIKPQNILLSERGNAVLADFGVAHTFHGQGNNSTRSLGSTAGTYQFLAPECFDEAGHGYNPFLADVWALGVTLFSFLCGSLPFYTTDQSSLDGITDAVRNEVPIVSTGVSATACAAIASAMEKVPGNRAKVEDLYGSAWVREGLTSAHREHWRLGGKRIGAITDQDREAAISIMSVTGFRTSLLMMVRMKRKASQARLRVSARKRESDAEFPEAATADAGGGGPPGPPPGPPPALPPPVETENPLMPRAGSPVEQHDTDKDDGRSNSCCCVVS